MSRYVDADKLIEYAEKRKLQGVPVDVIKSKATADVEEVVRCKDCKFRYTQTCFAKHETADNDFCTSGSRMDGGKE